VISPEVPPMARPFFPQAKNIPKRGRFRGSFPIVPAKEIPV
jgi:hypothetical protein